MSNELPAMTVADLPAYWRQRPVESQKQHVIYMTAADELESSPFSRETLIDTWAANAGTSTFPSRREAWMNCVNDLSAALAAEPQGYTLEDCKMRFNNTNHFTDGVLSQPFNTPPMQLTINFDMNVSVDVRAIGALATVMHQLQLSTKEAASVAAWFATKYGDSHHAP